MKKKTRTPLALLLILAMSLFPMACSPSDGTQTKEPDANAASQGDSGAQKSSGDKKKTLSVVMLGLNDTQIEAAKTKDTGPTPIDEYYMYNRAKAEEKYPDVTWEWNDWGWAETLDQKQRAAITAGTPPTNISGESFIPAYINAGILQEVPANILEGINESFIARGEDGKAYAIAYKTSTFMLFFNKDILTKCGYDPEKPPTTWDEWAKVSADITAQGKGEFWGGGIPSFPHNGGALRATPFFRQLGTDFGGGDKINLLDPGVQQALQYIRDMNANLPAGLGNGQDEGPMWNAFSKKGEQNIAFAIDGSWNETTSLRQDMNVGVAQLPLPEGGKPGNCLVGTVYIGVPVGVSQEDTDLFWDFYRNICLSEEALKNVIGDNYMVPVQSMIDDDSLYAGEGKASARVAVEDLRSGTYTGQAAFVKNDAQIWEIINQQVLARVTMTNDPIEEICKQGQAQVEALLK